MTTQTDVKSARLIVSGVFVSGRQRLKGILTLGTATAGVVDIFDDTVAPVAVTYGRAGTLVTVTHTSHGYATGRVVGLAFVANTGAAATNGNYTITVVDANTYTVVDINSGTVTAGTAAVVGAYWLTSVDSPATATVTPTLVDIPGEGVLAVKGLVARLLNQTSAVIFYG